MLLSAPLISQEWGRSRWKWLCLNEAQCTPYHHPHSKQHFYLIPDDENLLDTILDLAQYICPSLLRHTIGSIHQSLEFEQLCIHNFAINLISTEHEMSRRLNVIRWVVFQDHIPTWTILSTVTINISTKAFIHPSLSGYVCRGKTLFRAEGTKSANPLFPPPEQYIIKYVMRPKKRWQIVSLERG